MIYYCWDSSFQHFYLILYKCHHQQFQSRKRPTYSKNEEEKISDEEEDSDDESDDDVDIIRELLENLSQKESEQVEEEDTSSGEEEYVARVIFARWLNYEVGKTGQTKRHSGFCLLLLTPPTKFCRKTEKLNLNLIGMCQIPCFTEEYMRNSIKRNEYIFLEDLESFLFLMEVCVSYPIFHKHRF